ncbi:MAG: HEPN domain-containing protein [Acidimicrobiia bacterium]|nr:HEPN domain-containing protein [Acidimicrobiia bacterium]
MHQLTSSHRENLVAARRTLQEARSFQKLATVGLQSELALPAVSNFHEAARLAVTAVATFKGLRFRNAPGAHEGAVDYALGTSIVNSKDHAQLDELRQLRHDVNYPADIVEPTPRELKVIAALVERVISAAASRIPTPRIPPPPR